MLPEYKEKQEETMLKRYGYRRAFQNPEILAKVKPYLQSKEAEEKRRATWLAKYGSHRPSCSPEIKEKTKKTNRERYGTDWHTQLQNFLEKSKATRIARYGSYNPKMTPEVEIERRTKYYTAHFPMFCDALKGRKLELISSVDDYVKRDGKALKYRCTMCGLEFESEMRKAHLVFCPNCHVPRTSIGQETIYNFILNLEVRGSSQKCA